jgi:hypothetical protein
LLVAFLSARVLRAIIMPDALASIADDSSNYLVMARCLSPWSDPGVAALSVCDQQYFPAGFPLLLGMTGAGSSLPLAHTMVLAAFLASLPLLWIHASRVLGSPLLAHAVVMGFALLPGTLLGLQGILSETWYLLLVSVVLFLFSRDEAAIPSRLDAVTAGGALGLLV